MNRMKEFRKRQQKQTALQAEDAIKMVQQLQQALMVLFQKVFQIEKRLDVFDLRTLGTIRALKELNNRTDADEVVFQTVDKIRVEQFNEQDVKDDKNRNLVTAEGEAQAGQFASITIKAFKDGQENSDHNILRAKVEIGKVEILKEVDDAIVGMKTGETKRVSINLKDQVDAMEITLLALKKVDVAKTVDSTVQSNSGENVQSGDA